MERFALYAIAISGADRDTDWRMAIDLLADFPRHHGSKRASHQEDPTSESDQESPAACMGCPLSGCRIPCAAVRRVVQVLLTSKQGSYRPLCRLARPMECPRCLPLHTKSTSAADAENHFTSYRPALRAYHLSLKLGQPLRPLIVRQGFKFRL